jgi:hypothetical protein
MTQAPDDERHGEVLRPYQPVDDAVLAELAAGSALVTDSVANGVTVWPETTPEQLAAWNKLLTALSSDEDRELWLATAQLVYSLGRDPMPAGLPALLVATATEEEAADLLWMTQNLTELVGSITDDWIRAGMLTVVAEPGADLTAAGLEDVRELLDGLSDFVSDEVETGGAILQPLVDSVRASPIVRLTPLGDYSLRQVLLADDWLVPLVGSYRDVPAEELLDRLDVHIPDDVVVEAEIWIEARGRQWSNALRALADSARSEDPDLGPVRRAVLGTVLRATGPRVAPMLDDLADDPWLSAIAAGVRTGLGIGPELSLQDELWLTVDGLVVALSGDADEQAEAVEDSDVVAILSEPGSIHHAMQLSHPLTLEVLRMIAEVGGDRELAQRLRRAINSRSPKKKTTNRKR